MIITMRMARRRPRRSASGSPTFAANKGMAMRATTIEMIEEGKNWVLWARL